VRLCSNRCDLFVLSSAHPHSEYYFSIENLCKDIYLRHHMDLEGWVPISVIAGFQRIQALSTDPQLLLEVRGIDENPLTCTGVNKVDCVGCERRQTETQGRLEDLDHSWSSGIHEQCTCYDTQHNQQDERGKEQPARTEASQREERCTSSTAAGEE